MYHFYGFAQLYYVNLHLLAMVKKEKSIFIMFSMFRLNNTPPKSKSFFAEVCLERFIFTYLVLYKPWCADETLCFIKSQVGPPLKPKMTKNLPSLRYPGPGLHTPHSVY